MLELLERFPIGLIWVNTPKEICMQRVIERNKGAARPIDLTTAEEFYDFWTNEIALTYEFLLEVDGTDVSLAIAQIKDLVQTTP